MKIAVAIFTEWRLNNMMYYIDYEGGIEKVNIKNIEFSYKIVFQET